MSLLGQAILAFWADVEASGEADYVDWHNREHMPERCAVPGFLRGRRYHAIDAAPAYFTLYEAENTAVLTGAHYLERLNNPTPWRSRCLARFRNSNRTACRTTLSIGGGIGGALATIRLGSCPGREQALRQWLTMEALPKILERSGISAAHLCEADVETTTVKTKEKDIRDKPDEVARWVLLIEGSDGGIVGRACDESLNTKALEAHGAEPGAITGVYALHHVV